jgi:hypothetical protein
LPHVVAVVVAGALATKGVGRDLTLEALNAGPVEENMRQMQRRQLG